VTFGVSEDVFRSLMLFSFHFWEGVLLVMMGHRLVLSRCFTTFASLSGRPGASLHRVESRCTGLYVQCKAVALLKLFTPAGVHSVVDSPYAENELV